jgi:hypothetical protein
MITIQINDLVTLRDKFAAVGGDSLFRGQINHFEDPAGAPIINTSFDRKGCIPPAMLKWRYYAQEILRILSGPEGITIDHLSDAILQHYGWRSFYVDVTKSPGVAAWFASHAYTSGNRMIEMAEDVNEAFVMLVYDTPKYVHAESQGSIYIISKTKAQANGATFVDLTEIECEETKPRFHVQQGGLIGPFSRLSPAAVLERWDVPAAVLREYAAEGGLIRTEDLFPSREDDIFLSLLMAVPWELARIEGNDFIFRRGLAIPEYDYRATRRFSSNTAFSRRAWLSRTNHLGSAPSLSAAVRFGLEEESFYYHVEVPPQGFERVVNLLNRHPVIVVEINGIVRHPEDHRGDEYAKGIIIHRVADKLVQISELAVRHPGIEVAGARVLSPWTYRITESGAFVRQPHEHDCPCNNHGRHEHLFRYAQVFEDLLAKGAFKQVSELEYRHKNVD